MTAPIRRREFLTGGLALGATLNLPDVLRAEEPGRTIPNYVVPSLTAPLPDPIHLGHLLWDPTPLDYVVDERLMSGTAPIYKSITENDYNFPQVPPGTAPDIDPIAAIWGTPQMPPRPDPFDFTHRPILSSGPYLTRLVIYRPRDMRRFSGNVIIETIHHAGGGHLPIFGMINRFYASRGDVAVFVQHPITLPVIRYLHPERYGSVLTTDYSQIWGMLADTARLLRTDGKPNPMAARARRVYLTGYSFTALIVTTFAKRHHDVNRLPSGAPVFDGYVGGTGEGPMPPLDVPVLLAANQQSHYAEEDMPVRMAFDADGPLSRRRRYEIAGFQHTPLPEEEPGSAIPPPRSSETERRCAYQSPEGGIHSPNLVGRPVIEGMFQNLSRWVEAGIAPPRAPLIQSEAGQPKLDGNGNVEGGVRMPDISVPLGRYVTGSKDCALTGWMVPFMQEQLRSMYGSRARYLRQFAQAADALVAQRFIVADAAARMKASSESDAPAF